MAGGRAGGVCYHDNSKMRASIFTKLGLHCAGSDHLQLFKFWPSRAPGKGSAAGRKFLAPPTTASARAGGPKHLRSPQSKTLRKKTLFRAENIINIILMQCVWAPGVCAAPPTHTLQGPPLTKIVQTAPLNYFPLLL